MSWQCVHCNESHEDAFDSCWKCGRERIGVVSFNPFTATSAQSQPATSDLPCATTPHLPGREVIETRGLVFGEATLGSEMFEDFASGFNALGIRSDTYEGTLRDIRRAALRQMQEEAAAIGADAVVGITIGYECVGRFLLVNASGTAVVLKSLE